MTIPFGFYPTVPDEDQVREASMITARDMVTGLFPESIGDTHKAAKEMIGGFASMIRDEDPETADLLDQVEIDGEDAVAIFADYMERVYVEEQMEEKINVEESISGEHSGDVTEETAEDSDENDPIG
jgi:hypothetical protein